MVIAGQNYDHVLRFVKVELSESAHLIYLRLFGVGGGIPAEH